MNSIVTIGLINSVLSEPLAVMAGGVLVVIVVGIAVTTLARSINRL